MDTGDLRCYWLAATTCQHQAIALNSQTRKIYENKTQEVKLGEKEEKHGG